MGTSPPNNPRRPIRCPSCGSERLQLRDKPDRIDRVTQTPSDRIRRLFIADMRLYHCHICRLQFYDVGPAAGPAVQEITEAEAVPVLEKAATAEPPAAESATVIGGTVTIKGRLSSRENIVVNGEIQGDLEIPAHRLTIGMAGRIYGDVLAAEAEALGTVEGTLDARHKFTLRTCASMTGSIRTPRLTIEDGAFFQGWIETA
jgi:cytoskeletal protein CcmA (bactofilin family)